MKTAVGSRQSAVGGDRGWPVGPGRRRPASLKPTEEAIHRALVGHLTVRATGGTVWWHTPNGDIRHPGAGGRLKAMGTKPGMPDLMFLRDGQLYGLELKRIGGRVSEHQSARHAELAAGGAVVAVVEGLDAALRVLSNWGLIR